MDDSFAWQTVVQMPVMKGKKLELCWRADTTLDWVWLKEDVDGMKRDWEALFGIALQLVRHNNRACQCKLSQILFQPRKTAQMELRIADHYPTHATLKNGNHLEEPPAVEGFVHTIDAKTQRRTQLYLSTHDGYLFAVQIHRAVAPPSPSDLKNYSKAEEELRKDESLRLRLQLIDSKAFWDLRNVLVVRRASHKHARVHELSATPERDDHSPNEQLPSRLEEGELHRSPSDMEDEGGDEGLAKAKDKPRRRMHRSFELVLKNGQIVRFEVSSNFAIPETDNH